MAKRIKDREKGAEESGGARRRRCDDDKGEQRIQEENKTDMDI